MYYFMFFIVLYCPEFDTKTENNSYKTLISANCRSFNYLLFCVLFSVFDNFNIFFMLFLGMIWKSVLIWKAS